MKDICPFCEGQSALARKRISALQRSKMSNEDFLIAIRPLLRIWCIHCDDEGTASAAMRIKMIGVEKP